jgi:hypothetical protein
MSAPEPTIVQQSAPIPACRVTSTKQDPFPFVPEDKLAACLPPAVVAARHGELSPDLKLLPGSDQLLHFPKRSGDNPGSAKPERIDAMDYVARVLAQIPPPRKHLYSNAARGKRRRDQDTDVGHATTDTQTPPPANAAVRKRWADLLRRVYEIDPLVCPRCNATMRVISFITQPATIKRILDHLRRSSRVSPRPPPAPRSHPTSASL